MKTILSFADFIVEANPEQLAWAKRVIPSNRFDILTIDDPRPSPHHPSRLTGTGPGQSRPRQSVFERHQPNNLNPKQQSLAERLAKKLTPPPKK